MPCSLQLYTLDFYPHEAVGKYWAELLGAMNRLRYIYEVLPVSRRKIKIENLLDHLQMSIESFLYRTYELRERVVLLTLSIIGPLSKEESRRLSTLLKDPRQREPLIQQISKRTPDITESLQSLFFVLDIEGEIESRNKHTHNRFLELGLVTDDDIYNPWDALLDLKQGSQERHKLESLLRKEVAKTAKEHQRKINKVFKATMNFIEATEKYTH